MSNHTKDDVLAAIDSEIEWAEAVLKRPAVPECLAALRDVGNRLQEVTRLLTERVEMLRESREVVRDHPYEDCSRVLAERRAITWAVTLTSTSRSSPHGSTSGERASDLIALDIANRSPLQSLCEDALRAMCLLRGGESNYQDTVNYLKNSLPPSWKTWEATVAAMLDGVRSGHSMTTLPRVGYEAWCGTRDGGDPVPWDELTHSQRAGWTAAAKVVDYASSPSSRSHL